MCYFFRIAKIRPFSDVTKSLTSITEKLFTFNISNNMPRPPRCRLLRRGTVHRESSRIGNCYSHGIVYQLCRGYFAFSASLVCHHRSLLPITSRKPSKTCCCRCKDTRPRKLSTVFSLSGHDEIPPQKTLPQARRGNRQRSHLWNTTHHNPNYLSEGPFSYAK